RGPNFFRRRAWRHGDLRGSAGDRYLAPTVSESAALALSSHHMRAMPCSATTGDMGRMFWGSVGESGESAETLDPQRSLATASR
ncbi:MAG: hypothetical protein LC808_28255, partial [Actinobacteria bacterium]|nr:hypothetical protein [Actinomycetota bacterium]